MVHFEILLFVIRQSAVQLLCPLFQRSNIPFFVSSCALNRRGIRSEIMKSNRIRHAKPIARLVQLPAPLPAALGATGNAALSSGGLAVAASVEGLSGRFDIQVVPPSITDTLGDAALAEHIAADGPAIVGFSLYMWNVERSLHIAREVRQRSPETMLVIGGPEVHPDNTFLFRHTSFDVAVAGEGEEVFAQILSNVAGGISCESIPGTAVRRQGVLHPFTPRSQSLFPLNRYPSPYLAGVIPVGGNWSVYVETARGCSARCTYCFYSHGESAVRRLDAKAVAGLIRRIGECGAKEISILDPSFNLRPDFTDLLRAIGVVNRKRPLSFFAEIRAEALTEPQMDLLVKAGFTKLEIGLQSINSRTLKRAQRSGDPEVVIKACEKLKARGIELLIDLMVGLPGDARYDLRKGVEMLRDSGLGEFVQMMPLSVLPGTTMRRNADKEELLFDVAPPYRVIQTDRMRRPEIAESILLAEDILDRRVEEYPRPFLVAAEESAQPVDVLHVNLDGNEADVIATVSPPSARHVAVWLESMDIFARRGFINRVIEKRMAVDPYCTLDIVIVALEPFPLDLIDVVKVALASGPEWYLTRQLALRGENAARRVCVVIPENVNLPFEYLESLMCEAPVFKDVTLGDALKYPELLGDEIPAARIVGKNLKPGSERLKNLARRADPESVAFASRRLEAWWVSNVL